MNVVEKILAKHSGKKVVSPGQIIDVSTDCRLAENFGGAHVVKNILDNGLGLDDPDKTFFAFNSKFAASDQYNASSKDYCRNYAHEHGLKVYDITGENNTHPAIDKGLILPGETLFSTDPNACIMGAIGAFGQGMGIDDIAAIWANGSTWFKVPKSVKVIFQGLKPDNISAMDFALNMQETFDSYQIVGHSVELYGEAINKLTLEERITISLTSKKIGALIFLFTPNDAVVKALEDMHGKKVSPVFADDDAVYDKVININVTTFKPMNPPPAQAHNETDLKEFINPATNKPFTNGSGASPQYEPIAIETKNAEAGIAAGNEKEAVKHNTIVEGRAWLIDIDDIDSEMIYSKRHPAITNFDEMGQYTFENLAGYEDFAKKAQAEDIIIAGKHFGIGNSGQQAIDCFKSLGISCILAKSFDMIYERNAINNAFPILNYKAEILETLDIKTGDRLKIDFVTGKITNITKSKHGNIEPFPDIQMELYKQGGLLP